MLGLIRWIGHVRFEKIFRKFVRTVSCIWCTTRAHFIPAFSQWRNRAERIKTWVLGLIRWIGHIRFQKIFEKFVHTVSCIQCTTRADFVPVIFTVAKSCETHQNMSLWSNKVDWTRSFQKNLRKVCSHGFVHLVHNPGPLRSCYFYSSEIVRNTSKHEFWV